MESFKLPDFADKSAPATPVSSEILESYKPLSDQLGEAEPYTPNIIDDKKKTKSRKKVDYSDFNSGEFNEVDTLLTNVEEYSRRIREDVDKYARNVRNETDLFRSETELELANALIKRIEAEKQAKAIIEDAEATRDEVLKQGHDEGYKAGFEEGLKQHQEENQRNTGAVLELLKEMEALRNTMMQKHEEQIVRLSLLIAEKVVHKKLAEEKEFVLNTLKSAMKHFEGKGNVKIRLHPVEYDFIASNQPDLEKFLEDSQIISLMADQNVNPSAPVIESDHSVVDLDLSRQFKEIEGRLTDCIDDRRILFSE